MRGNARIWIVPTIEASSRITTEPLRVLRAPSNFSDEPMQSPTSRQRAWNLCSIRAGMSGFAFEHTHGARRRGQPDNLPLARQFHHSAPQGGLAGAGMPLHTHRDMRREQDYAYGIALAGVQSGRVQPGRLHRICRRQAVPRVQACAHPGDDLALVVARPLGDEGQVHPPRRRFDQVPVAPEAVDTGIKRGERIPPAPVRKRPGAQVVGGDHGAPFFRVLDDLQHHRQRRRRCSRLPDVSEWRIDLSGYIRYRLDLFETRPMVLKAGDRVRWTRNDSTRSLINGEHAEMLSIRRVNLTIRTQDGREIVMARDDPQLHHLDHAYSSTVHAAQGITCDRAIAVLDTERRGVADQATFYVELTRARDNVVLLTDDREALIEALETSPAKQMSALRAIGEQFGVSPETDRPKRPAEKATVLDEAERENRKAAERFLDRALSAAAASIRQREEHATIAASDRAHVTEDPGYGEWRDDARRALDGCRRILDDPETYGWHLDPRLGVEDEIRRLSARIESTLASDKAEIERHRQELEATKAKERDIDMGLEL